MFKLLKITPKRSRKGIEVSTSNDYDNSKFSSFEVKIRFEKTSKVNKRFTYDRGMEFDSKP